MPKKQATHKDYIVVVENNGSITVSRIYDNVIASLREVAAAISLDVDPAWNTQGLGRKVIQALGGTNNAQCGEYTIVSRSTGKIDTYRLYANTIGALREIAEQVGFDYDKGWTTRQLGSKLVDFLNK